MKAPAETEGYFRMSVFLGDTTALTRIALTVAEIALVPFGTDLMRSDEQVEITPEFRYGSRADEYFVPLAMEAKTSEHFRDRGNHQGLFALARRKADVSPEQANLELRAIAASLARGRGSSPGATEASPTVPPPRMDSKMAMTPGRRCSMVGFECRRVSIDLDQAGGSPSGRQTSRGSGA